MESDLTLSICVPAFNEELNLCRAIADLQIHLYGKLKWFELIIVDDGSRDKTLLVAKGLTDKFGNIRILRHADNFGIGRCYRDALAIAKGKYFTWFPSDGEDSAEEILRCLEHAQEGVIVTAHHVEYDRRSGFRRALSRSYTFILNISFGQRLRYYNGISVISTQSARAMILVSDGFFCNAEIIMRAIKSGCRVVELSVPLGKRISGRSKALSFRSLRMAGMDLIRIFKG